jgi:hypothetical protein
MVRVEADQQAAARLRPLEGGGRQEDKGFASALASVRDATAQNAQVSRDPAGDSGGETRRNPNLPVGPPLAERWGQYGPGATAAGYGATPDPSLFGGYPIGSNSPAHPLNPEGNTYTPPFTVPGYTGRGTPIPPGFYNLAYYNRYLAEGGTPIEGFDGYAASQGSLTEIYGSFGDGRARATSFVPPPGPGEIASIPDAEAPGATGGGDVAVTRDADSIVEPAATSRAAAPTDADTVSDTPRAAEPPRAVEPAPAAEPAEEPTLPRPIELALADLDDAVLSEAARQAARAGILALLDEILDA